MTKFSTQKDDALVQLTLLGDQGAFEELVIRHEKAVKGTACKITGNPFSAEDAAQDAFVAAWMGLDALREHGKFGSWVCAIAKNRARDLVTRYRAAIPDISLDTALLQPESEDAEPVDEDFTRRQELREAVDILGDPIRQVVRLHYFDGYSVKEIAGMLSLPEGTVKWRLSEGRKQLRKGYGIMEDKYDEKEAFTKRVMRQVEQLKLWKLKNDKTGFEEAYHELLALIDSMDETGEKYCAKADVLQMGLWFLPGMHSRKIRDEQIGKIKEAAEKGGKQDVMRAVMANEWYRSGMENAQIIREKQIPYLEKLGFRGTLGYVYFQLGCEILNKGEEFDSALACYRKVLELLQPGDIYYATALAAIKVTEHIAAQRSTPCPLPKNRRCAYDYHMGAEELRKIDGKWYYWNRSLGGFPCRGGLLWNSHYCDCLLFDPEMKPGDEVVSSDGTETLCCKAAKGPVKTPAGVFENCIEMHLIGKCWEFQTQISHTVTTFCPGVGIVRQVAAIEKEVYEWQLAAYEVQGGGKELFPMEAGNRWDYALISSGDYRLYDMTNRCEVIFREDGKTIMEQFIFAVPKGYVDSFDGWKEKMKQNYFYQDKNDPDKKFLQDVSTELQMLEKHAVTKRQKRYAAIARDVMERIFRTDKTWNSGTKTEGKWNFFKKQGVAVKDRKTVWNFVIGVDEWFDWGDDAWSNWQPVPEPLTVTEEKVRYNLFYDCLVETTEDIAWSEDWVPGYAEEKKGISYDHHDYRLEVLPDETVETPAGIFENCRHIFLELTNTNVWWKGKMEYWFAPGVGIVKFSHPLGEEERENIWQLTDYRGRGEGYFPIDDGLFRRYEPKQLDDGWRASVEYTFDEDENGTVFFRNALGERDL